MAKACQCKEAWQGPFDEMYHLGAPVGHDWRRRKRVDVRSRGNAPPGSCAKKVHRLKTAGGDVSLLMEGVVTRALSKMHHLGVPVRNDWRRRGRVDVWRRGRDPSREMHHLGLLVGDG